MSTTNYGSSLFAIVVAFRTALQALRAARLLQTREQHAEAEAVIRAAEPNVRELDPYLSGMMLTAASSAGALTWLTGRQWQKRRRAYRDFSEYCARATSHAEEKMRTWQRDSEIRMEEMRAKMHAKRELAASMPVDPKRARLDAWLAKQEVAS